MAAGRASSSCRISSPRARASPSTPTSPASSTTRRTSSNRRSARWTSPSRISTRPRFRSPTCLTTSTRTRPRSSRRSVPTARSRPPLWPTPPPPTPRSAPYPRRSGSTRGPSCSTPSSTRACSSLATRGHARSPSGCATRWAGLPPPAPWTTLCTRTPTKSSSPTRRCRSACSRPTPTPSATWSPHSWRPTAAATGRRRTRTSTGCASSTPRWTTRLRASRFAYFRGAGDRGWSPPENCRPSTLGAADTTSD
mmetsp:Transcript_3233/g.10895  ORF Transcript_3233/g.10895 Transcript_3233/m.10895 type:complete len:252 (-) Transcript_3233:150-905(-)